MRIGRSVSVLVHAARTAPGLVLLHEVQVLSDSLKEATDGIRQVGMSCGEVSPGSGLALPGLGHGLVVLLAVELGKVGLLERLDGGAVGQRHLTPENSPFSGLDRGGGAGRARAAWLSAGMRDLPD
jgi:hypothetical protein